MATTTNELGKTLELLWDIGFYGAKKTFEKIGSTASIYLKALVKYLALCIVIFFVSIVLKATTGWIWFAYIGAFPAIILTIALGILGSPLGVLINMAREGTLNPVAAGDNYIKFFTAAFFVELLAFIYVIEMPVNLETVLKMMILALALIVGIYRFGTIFPPKFYNVIITVTMSYTTLSLFEPNPIGFVLNGFDHTYSTYEGRKYKSDQSIYVFNDGNEYSDYVTLVGSYEPRFEGWVEFLQKDADKPTKVNSYKEDFNFHFRTFRVRSQTGVIKFVPNNR